MSDTASPRHSVEERDPAPRPGGTNDQIYERRESLHVLETASSGHSVIERDFSPRPGDTDDQVYERRKSLHPSDTADPGYSDSHEADRESAKCSGAADVYQDSGRRKSLHLADDDSPQGSDTELEKPPKMGFGGADDALVQRWSWIESHCVRRQDLMRKNRKNLDKAVSNLVDKGNPDRLQNWLAGMTSVLIHLGDRPWWVRALQVIGIDRSQYLLKAQRKEIQQCQDMVLEIISRWDAEREPKGWSKRKGDLIKAIATARAANDDRWKGSNTETKDELVRVLVKQLNNRFQKEDIQEQPGGGKWNSEGVLGHMKKKLECLESQKKPIGHEAGYIVISLHSRTSIDPLERIVRISTARHFFRDLHWGIVILEGWRGLLSLKSLKAFGMTKVSIMQARISLIIPD
jgi:hypothetical protein